MTDDLEPTPDPEPTDTAEGDEPGTFPPDVTEDEVVEP